MAHATIRSFVNFYRTYSSTIASFVQSVQRLSVHWFFWLMSAASIFETSWFQLVNQLYVCTQGMMVYVVPSSKDGKKECLCAQSKIPTPYLMSSS